MRYLQYQGPSDMFDASNIIGKAGSIFYVPGTSMVDVDQRGNVIKVTNEVADNLLTYPRHQFAEVADDKATELIAKQTAARKVREQRDALFARDSDNFSVPAPSIDDQIAAVPVAEPAAISAPATPASIRAEVQAGKTTPNTASTPVGE